MILVVEGNPAAAGANLQNYGIAPYAQGFALVLQSLAPYIECEIAYPAEQADGGLPPGRTLRDYDGIVWTGSSLCISQGEDPAIQAQIDLARAAFESGVPVFGSCWGLQVMAVALGGRVRACPAGREIGIARQVQLSQAGLAHPMFTGKSHCFDALATHSDEVYSIPQGAEILAGNEHSPVQALAIERDGCSFWGVQYHPEFDLETVAALIRRRGQGLVDEGFFTSLAELEEHAGKLKSIYLGEAHRGALAWQLGVTRDVLDPARRHRELYNWLQVKLEA